MGLAENLLMLMADGRVQTVGADVDPEVFRKMLTIAGEEHDENSSEPVDPAAEGGAVPGTESKQSAPRGALAESEPVWDDEDHPPLSPQFAGDDEQPARQVNPRVSLAQKLVLFEQPVRPRREVLRVVRDLVGVPLRFEGPDIEARLREGIGFTLRDVTVQQVLDRTLAQSGLSWRIENGHIVVFVADSPPGGQ
jgi:hypothetical protein